MPWPHVFLRSLNEPYTHPGLRRWLCRCTSAPITQRDKAFLFQPTSPRYGFEVGTLCGTFLIAFVFAIASPIVTIGCFIALSFAYVFWRYTVLYVYIRKYESGGLLWPFLFSRILAMLNIMAVFTACVLMVKKAYIQAIVVLILVPICVARFRSYCFIRRVAVRIRSGASERVLLKIAFV